MRILKLSFSSLAISALLVVPAVAQVSVPLAVTAEQKAAVKELLDAMNFRQMMSQVAAASAAGMPQLIDQMTKSMLEGAGETIKADAQKSLSANMAKFSKRSMEIYNDPDVLNGIEDLMTRMYLKYFTTEEIRATTTFYISPAGRKALSVMPQMMQETMPEMMRLFAPKMNALAQEFARDIVADAKKNAAAGAAK